MKQGTKWFAIGLVVLLSAAVLLAGCGEKKKDVVVEEKVITMPKSIETEVGENFSFTLDANGSTGYTWVFANPVDAKMLQYNGSVYHNDSNVPGAPGRENFRFKAIGEGNTEIVLNYVQPWDKETAPAKTFTMTVTVKGKDVGEVKEYGDPNVPIDVKVEQEFLIVLDSNPTTGYAWRLAGALPKNLKLEETSFTASEGQRIGAPGKQYWRLEGMAPVSAKITFNYVRPWEKGVSPAKTVTFTVNAK